MRCAALGREVCECVEGVWFCIFLKIQPCDTMPDHVPDTHVVRTVKQVDQCTTSPHRRTSRCRRHDARSLILPLSRGVGPSCGPASCLSTCRSRPPRRAGVHRSNVAIETAVSDSSRSEVGSSGTHVARHAPKDGRCVALRTRVTLSRRHESRPVRAVLRTDDAPRARANCG